MEDGNSDSPAEHALDMLCFLYNLNAVDVQAGQIFRLVDNQFADKAKEEAVVLRGEDKHFPRNEQEQIYCRDGVGKNCDSMLLHIRT